MTFRIEVWNGYPDGERLSVVDLPDDESTPTARYALEHGAKSTAEQMLGKFGVKSELQVITIQNAMSSDEVTTEVEDARASEATGETLPKTSDIVGESAGDVPQEVRDAALDLLRQDQKLDDDQFTPPGATGLFPDIDHSE